MESFTDKIAVITGAGSGMGRDLAVRLAAEGAHLALCDLNDDNLTETAELCRAEGPATVNTMVCDVTSEPDLERFRDETLAAHDTESINLLFNNAGIGTTESFLTGDRATWEKTFEVCWDGVYLTSRVFVPLLVAADEAHIINTSSINGFWASLGPSRAHTAYCSAKFAVKGFTEALINEFRLHAPHVGVSLVMPGHIGTSIVANSRRAVGDDLVPEVTEISAAFRNEAATSSIEAADIILDGVRKNRWRILVGDDAHLLDQMVRAEPERAYEPDFVDDIHAAGVLHFLVN